MRDLGLIGEYTFSTWCAQVGLVANGSKIDQTGWDFFVEFPFDSALSAQGLHKPAFECKVQVKATDKNDRKWQIKLSNLRRLVTTPTPTFFVFIEFDGKNFPQKAFVVHVDEILTSKVLRRLHEVGKNNSDSNIHKKKMTIQYDTSHALNELSGECLKKLFSKHIGADFSKYIFNKKKYLESAGYEEGRLRFSFVMNGAENLKNLMDVSIGKKTDVEIERLRFFDMRFGVLSSNPFLDVNQGIFSMPNLQPCAKGSVLFGRDRLSPKLAFDAELYLSPFNRVVPDESKKIRVKGGFFDFDFNPYAGSASYFFSFGEGVRLEVKKFRDAVKLIEMIGNSKEKHCISLDFQGFPRVDFKLGCDGDILDLSLERKVLDSALSIIYGFDVSERVDISFDEIYLQSSKIFELEMVLNTSKNFFRLEYSVSGEGYDESKETACILFWVAPIGSYMFGVIFVLTGSVEVIVGGKYRLDADDMIIEQRIVSKNNNIQTVDVFAAVEAIERKYSKNFSVVTMFSKEG